VLIRSCTAVLIAASFFPNYRHVRVVEVAEVFDVRHGTVLLFVRRQYRTSPDSHSDPYKTTDYAPIYFSVHTKAGNVVSVVGPSTVIHN